MSWTEERIALLKKMWKEGKSAADIAKTLGKGVTRNAVIGKAHRMSLSGRPSPIKKPAAAVKKEAPVTAKKQTAAAAPVVKGLKKQAAPLPTGKGSPVLAKETEELKKLDKDIPPLDGGVSLLDLSERMCKWPFGDPKEDGFTFCGRQRRPGTPYCPDHAAAAYQTSSRNRMRGPVAAVVNDKVVVAVEETVEIAVTEEEDDEVVA